MTLTLETARAVLANVSFPDTDFIVVDEGRAGFFLQVQQTGACNVGGRPMTWRGRKWRLSNFMTKSEVVQTAFLAVLTAVEHETREQFKYRGAAIFGPHFDVERLVTLAANPAAQDMRKDTAA